LSVRSGATATGPRRSLLLAGQKRGNVYVHFVFGSPRLKNKKKLKNITFIKDNTNPRTKQCRIYASTRDCPLYDRFNYFIVTARVVVCDIVSKRNAGKMSKNRNVKITKTCRRKIMENHKTIYDNYPVKRANWFFIPRMRFFVGSFRPLQHRSERITRDMRGRPLTN